MCNVMREVGRAEGQEFDTAGKQAGQSDEKPTNSSCLTLCVLWSWKRTTAEGLPDGLTRLSDALALVVEPGSRGLVVDPIAFAVMEHDSEVTGLVTDVAAQPSTDAMVAPINAYLDLGIPCSADCESPDPSMKRFSWGQAGWVFFSPDRNVPVLLHLSIHFFHESFSFATIRFAGHPTIAGILMIQSIADSSICS